MKTIQRTKEDSRVEFRVSKEDKELFDYASSLSGFKSFSEFARLVIHKEVKAIVKAHSEGKIKTISHSKIKKGIKLKFNF